MKGKKQIRIGIVGPCKSGKSVLKAALENLGYEARHIAQEHSSAPHMWRLIANPDFLIFLEVDFQSTLQRGLKWLQSDYANQLERLADARAHADLVIDTSARSPEQVLQIVTKALVG